MAESIRPSEPAVLSVDVAEALQHQQAVRHTVFPTSQPTKANQQKKKAAEHKKTLGLTRSSTVEEQVDKLSREILYCPTTLTSSPMGAKTNQRLVTEEDILINLQSSVRQYNR